MNNKRFIIGLGLFLALSLLGNVFLSIKVSKMKIERLHQERVFNDVADSLMMYREKAGYFEQWGE